MPQKNQAIYSVSQLNNSVKKLLESGLGSIWLSGEISNFVCPSSGHWYFSLKDQRAQVRCAMFRGQNSKVHFMPANGQQILARVSVSLYEPRGEYQLIVQSMQTAGEGALKQAYEQLKCKLAAQGLFAQTAKKSIPTHPSNIGIISSATGAALQDILAVLKRRAPQLPIIIYPSLVQGEQAAVSLNKALHIAIERNEVDVLIMARGGGSLEDLWCFNDEQLAYSIFNCPIPLISAVGHEIDFTICDLVADLRAPTPSAAAEQVAGEKEHQLQNLAQKKHQLYRAFSAQINHKNQLQKHLQHKLQLFHPKQKLQQQSQRLDELHIRLQRKFEQHYYFKLQKQQNLKQKLLRNSPNHRVELAKQDTKNLKLGLHNAMKHLLSSAKEKHHSQLAQLETVSPLATLARGYSVVTDKNKNVIRSHSDIKIGQELHTKLNKGSFTSQVIDMQEN